MISTNSQIPIPAYPGSRTIIIRQTSNKTFNHGSEEYDNASTKLKPKMGVAGKSNRVEYENRPSSRSQIYLRKRPCNLQSGQMMMMMMMMMMCGPTLFPASSTSRGLFRKMSNCRRPSLRKSLKQQTVCPSAQLHLDSLRGKTSKRDIKDALTTLPKGRDTIEKAYKDNLIRINNQSKQRRDLAHMAIIWNQYANELFNVEQLREALSIQVDDEESDRDGLSDSELIIDVILALQPTFR